MTKLLELRSTLKDEKLDFNLLLIVLKVVKAFELKLVSLSVSLDKSYRNGSEFKRTWAAG